MAKTQGYPCSCQCCLKAHREAEQAEKRVEESRLIVLEHMRISSEHKAQNARLREALEKISRHWSHVQSDAFDSAIFMEDTAKEALQQLPNHGKWIKAPI